MTFGSKRVHSAAFNQHRTARSSRRIGRDEPQPCVFTEQHAQSRDRGLSRHSAPSTALVATGASRTAIVHERLEARTSLEARSKLRDSCRNRKCNQTRPERKKNGRAPEKTMYSGMRSGDPRAPGRTATRGPIHPHIFFLYILHFERMYNG